jgi:WS/DGAT/MGAT family acyltransferase
LTGVDCAWLRMDEPNNLMMINGVLLFERPLDLDEIRQALERRLLALPRFSRRVVARGARRRLVWEDDPDFDLGRHLVEERLPEPGDEESLRELVSRLMSRPLDRRYPLWQLHHLAGYQGGGALLWRIHHCMGDGIALMLALLSMTELGPATAEGKSASPHDVWKDNPLRSLFHRSGVAPEAARQHLEEVMPGALRLLAGPAEKLKSLSRLQKSAASIPAFGRLALRLPDPKTPLKGPLVRDKRAGWSEPIPLRRVERLGKELGGTVNDILTTAVSGALRRYLLAAGYAAALRDVRAVVPVSLRPLEQMAELGNRFGLVFLSLPLGEKDPLQRLSEVRRRMGSLKRSFEPVVALEILRLLGSVPKRAQSLVVRIFGAKGTAVLTNVPGPRQPIYFTGREISAFIFWVPQSGRLGMGISIVSYAGNVRIGLATDAGLIPDPQEIVDGIESELRVLEGLAGGP